MKWVYIALNRAKEHWSVDCHHSLVFRFMKGFSKEETMEGKEEGINIPGNWNSMWEGPEMSGSMTGVGNWSWPCWNADINGGMERSIEQEESRALSCMALEVLLNSDHSNYPSWSCIYNVCIRLRILGYRQCGAGKLRLPHTVTEASIPQNIGKVPSQFHTWCDMKERSTSSDWLLGSSLRILVSG